MMSNAWCPVCDAPRTEPNHCEVCGLFWCTACGLRSLTLVCGFCQEFDMQEGWDDGWTDGCSGYLAKDVCVTTVTLGGLTKVEGVRCYPDCWGCWGGTEPSAQQTDHMDEGGCLAFK
jgi:hypothetical protein